ncbi:GPR1/FUN34/yaaH family-domain-containing protein [Cunninghamella echinulata]|nr:GPR1/FUN34/yaaH family-domain-containing protein [Cunninghamella echinulata]
MEDQPELITTLTRGLRHRLSVPEVITGDTKVPLKDLKNIIATYNLTRRASPVVNGQNADRPIHIGNPGVVGLFSFGVVTIILGIFRLFLPWKSQVILLPSALLFGGLTQMIAGFFDLFVGGTFSATILISYGAFWTGNGMMMAPSMNIVYNEYTNLEDRNQAHAIYCFMWAFYTLMLTGISLAVKSGTFILTWCLLFVFLALTLEAIWYLDGTESIIRASGVCAILAALGSFYSGCTAIFEEQGANFYVGHYPWVKDKSK